MLSYLNFSRFSKTQQNLAIYEQNKSKYQSSLPPTKSFGLAIKSSGSWFIDWDKSTNFSVWSIKFNAVFAFLDISVEKNGCAVFKPDFARLYPVVMVGSLTNVSALSIKSEAVDILLFIIIYNIF